MFLGGVTQPPIISELMMRTIHSISMISPMMKVLVLGGSGEVGKQVVAALLKQDKVEVITLVARRELPELEKLDKRIRLLKLGSLEELKGMTFQGHNCAVTAMGIGKASTSQKDELMHVDCQLNVWFAQACKKSGVDVFGLLTSVGADINQTWGMLGTKAGGGWYMHVKGKCQEETGAVGFRRLSIFRPAGIMGNANTGVFNYIGPAIDWMLPQRYKSIRVQNLGIAMARRLRKDFEEPGLQTKIYQGQQLFAQFA